ncbi:hypothetical protein [Cupriavidus nantongensis]|uniref:Uncharacterized protein n=1 Tax=Cupriavidus nantongensis TaxID=1796606 RepID=A0A142JNG7_9BURK|nr:hypothetical protein [Cupriavidus nantongensis]AMR79629.1 hypothetical protein A2G96_18795 [Cupriavidus nantongensis]
MAVSNSHVAGLKGQKPLKLNLSESFFDDLKRESIERGITVTDTILSRAEAGSQARAHLESVVQAARMVVQAFDATTDEEARRTLNELADGLLSAIEGIHKVEMRNPKRIRRRARAATK